MPFSSCSLGLWMFVQEFLREDGFSGGDARSIDLLAQRVCASARMASLRSLSLETTADFYLGYWEWDRDVDELREFQRARLRAIEGPALSRLTKLDLADNNMWESDVEMLRGLLGKLTGLRDLSLRLNVSLRAAQLMKEVLPVMGLLTSLDISETKASLEVRPPQVILDSWSKKYP